MEKNYDSSNIQTTHTNLILLHVSADVPFNPSVSMRGPSHQKQLFAKSQLNIYEPLHRPQSNKECV